MNNLIKIRKFSNDSNTIRYIVECNGDWKKYINANEVFYANYSINISNVDESLAIIPLLSNLLPLSWIFDLEIEIENLDKTFYEQINKIKDGYQKMYPEIKMRGILNVKNIKLNANEKKNNAVMFSGGVDAFNTLLNHIEEKPALITIWGADIPSDDFQGWNVVNKCNIEVANTFDLNYYPIKSNFRDFINYDGIMKELKKICKYEWWHDFQHGLALLGLVAPLSKVIDINKLYIASSFTAEQIGNYKCASDPIIDNNVAFGGTQAYHDGYEFNRQQKIRNITNYKNSHIDSIKLRVCWETKTGYNCCNCEKCYRTIMGIIAEKKDPKKYNLNITNKQYKKMIKFVNKYAKYNKNRYQCIQDRIKENYVNDLPKELKKFVKIKIKEKKPLYLKIIEKIIYYIIKVANKMKKIGLNLIKKIYKKCKNIYFKVCILKSVCTSKRKIYIIGVPHHGNIGDHAITIAEYQILKDTLKNYKIVEIESFFALENIEFIRKVIKKSPIIINGGGFLGSLWIKEEEMFRSILSNFKDNKIIVFPQTIYFENTLEGHNELVKSQQIYQSHSNLKIFLREKYSYDFMKENFTKCNIYLVPDIVLYLDAEEYNYKREGVLFCMRSDKEKINDFKDDIESFIIAKQIKIIDNTDTVIDKRLYKFNRKKYVYNKIKQFAKYKVVVTDRLHGMIFALLSKTPCLVFQNKSPKILGVYEWIKDVDYIKLCTKDNYRENLDYLLNYAADKDLYSIKEKFESLVREIEKVAEK